MRHNAPGIMPVLASLHAAEQQFTHPVTHAPPVPLPFITISRQAGAGGHTFARQLAERLNQRDNAADADGPKWTVFDNELVDRVAVEHHLAHGAVADLEDHKPSWLDEVLSNFIVSGPVTEEQTIYRRVATTIRNLCEKGRVIIVGRGSVLVTADMPAAIHIRFVAPVQNRIEATAKSLNCTPEVAAQKVHEIDAARKAFYRRHFPKLSLESEMFTAVFNTSASPAERIIESILALIPIVRPSAAAAAPAPIPVLGEKQP